MRWPFICLTRRNQKPSPQQFIPCWSNRAQKDGDGLPDKATGAALDAAFASGIDEAEAVRETVPFFKTGRHNPHWTLTGLRHPLQREEEGHEIDEDERALMGPRALDENSVIHCQMTPFFDRRRTSPPWLPLCFPSPNVGANTAENTPKELLT